METYIEAMNKFVLGEIDSAWEIAKKDDGLISDITKEQWIKFATDNVIKKLLESLTSTGPTMDKSEKFSAGHRSQQYIRALFNIYHNSGYNTTY